MVKLRKYDSNAPTIFNEKIDWLYTSAKAVDINNPSELENVKSLDFLFSEYICRKGWIAVSSNNIYWNKTENPVRIIKVPYQKLGEFVTLINPKINLIGEKTFTSEEGCGGIPGLGFNIERYSNINVSGYALKNSDIKPVNFQYKITNRSSIEDKLVSATVQHEIDHLNGILIIDKGKLVGYNSNLIPKTATQNVELLKRIKRDIEKY